MKRDIAIEEIRAVRTKISAKYHHNTRQLLEHYRKMEKKYKGRIGTAKNSFNHNLVEH